MSTAEIREHIQSEWWNTPVLELPGSSSRAELRSAALAALDHVRQHPRNLDVEPAPVAGSYSQARATARKRQRQQQRAAGSST